MRRNRFHLITASALLLTLAACNENSKKQTATQVSDEIEMPTTEQEMNGEQMPGMLGNQSEMEADGHNAANSLDFYGVYEGTLPAASAQGIATTLVLNKDMSCKLTSVYIGSKEASSVEEGTFSIDKNTITARFGDGTVKYYRVQEGRLIFLTAEKKPVEGALAEHYVLKQTTVY